MPPPIKVELVQHDPRWAANATAEAKLLADVFGLCLVTVHHVGSTAIPGIRAKPILDLMPVVSDLVDLDACRSNLEALGYEWWGEYGLPGRRYCTKAEAVTGRRLVQLHCYKDGSAEITRHLAFRDYLRAHPHRAAAYDAIKSHCQVSYPDDSHAYADCKAAWIVKAETDALQWYRLHRAQAAIRR